MLDCTRKGNRHCQETGVAHRNCIRVPNRARELAASGEFYGWWGIEVYLRKKEYCPEARHVLDAELIREDLARLCKEAKGDRQ